MDGVRVIVYNSWKRNSMKYISLETGLRREEMIMRYMKIVDWQGDSV
jgi:hypothetical protein